MFLFQGSIYLSIGNIRAVATIFYYQGFTCFRVITQGSQFGTFFVAAGQEFIRFFHSYVQGCFEPPQAGILFAALNIGAVAAVIR